MFKTPRSRRFRLTLAAAGLILLGAAAGGVAVSAVRKAPPSPKYNSLARTVNPHGAKGRALGLSRVVIQPGAKIPLHYHKGTQVSTVRRGTLTYTVKKGGVKVMAGPGDDGRLVRKIRAGQTGKIRAGQWLVEQPSTIHRAANRGNGKIVIYISSLLRRNAPPSTLWP